MGWVVKMVTIACFSGRQVHGLRITSDHSVGEDPRYFVLQDIGARCLVCTSGH